MTMSRKQFIQSHGATCKNWFWSWSFVNERERFVIFGAWDPLGGGMAKIFSEDWKIDAKGRATRGYKQSLEHIRLIEEEDYELRTLSMEPETGRDGVIPRIKSFERKLTIQKLKHVGKDWFATETD